MMMKPPLVLNSFIVTKLLSADSYTVKDYNNPDSTSRKCKDHDLYLFPAVLFPSKELDTTDICFLIYEHAPIPSLLTTLLQIKLRNVTYFPCNAKGIINTTTDKKSNDLDHSLTHYQPSTSFKHET